jgi:predicted anti-sigma-YlaC factor YlaD
MTCRELVEFLSDYLANDLAGVEKDAFEEHLRDCDACTRYLEAFAATVELAREAFGDPDVPVPSDVPERLLSAILRARRQA